MPDEITLKQARRLIHLENDEFALLIRDGELKARYADIRMGADGLELSGQVLFDRKSFEDFLDKIYRNWEDVCYKVGAVGRSRARRMRRVR
jgi:hypothetical protein